MGLPEVSTSRHAGLLAGLLPLIFNLTISLTYAEDLPDMRKTFPPLLVLLFLLIGCSTPQEQTDNSTNWQFHSLTKLDEINPILTPAKELTFDDPLSNKTVKWESRNVLNPTALVKDGKVYLLYRAQDSTGTSRIGMAVSTDGKKFEKQQEPVFYPNEDEMKKYEWNYRKLAKEEVGEDCYFCLFDGVEDPRIVAHPAGGFVMTYTAYEGKTARLALASSPDLINWTKHGLVLKGEQYQTLWSKSGAIVSRRNGEQIVAEKINGKYWMYFGDKFLYMAYSDDLINWEPLVDEESGALKSVLHPRPGYFDSRLVEPGPYALKTNAGIVLIYNASNAANVNDPNLPKFTYAAGQALFDANAPYKLLDRTDDYFIYPDKPYEKIGEVNEVCFVEGLVPFNGNWYLYYGTADTRIAVATVRFDQ
jgi:predicted GH43/DUF377 family glycosyl hydrolase